MTAGRRAGPGPRVSVVMPFLNLERFIAEAIESVLAQTYEAWELLLVDDGSTDGSSDIARRHAERYPERIRYFEHPGHVNRGASASRNVGIRHARGEYIALLDADDVWLPHKLEQQVPLLDARPEVGCLYGRTLWWYSWTGVAEDRERDHIPPLGFPPDTVLAPPTLLVEALAGRAPLPCPCSILIRRSVVDGVGGFEEAFRIVFTDQAFFSKLFLAAPVFVAAGCWDKYRQHPDSSCSVVTRSGQLRERRGEYLQWLAAYLRERRLAHGELWSVVQNAVWSYRHPTLAWLLRRARRRVSSAARLVRRLPRGPKAAR